MLAIHTPPNRSKLNSQKPKPALPDQPNKLSWRAWFVLLVFVALLRSATVWQGWNSLRDDPDAYAQLAVSLANSGAYGFQVEADQVRPTAFRPPLYPWLLSWLVADGKVSVVGLATGNVLLSLLIAALAASVANRLRLAWPIMAGVWVTMDPLLSRASQLMMTELLATFLGLLAWWLWLALWPNLPTCSLDAQNKNSRSMPQWFALYALGLVLGLSILARPTAAVWFLLFAACMLLVGCQCWKRRILDSVTVSICVLICVVPWTLRNWSQLGVPIWATTHGGYTLLLANNPSLYQHFEKNGPDRNWNVERFNAAWASRGIVDKELLLQDEYWQREPSDTTTTESAPSDRPTVQVHSLGELADDQLAYEIASQTIREHRGTFLLSCLYRTGWFWALWPNGVGLVTATAFGGWYFFIFAYAIVGVGKAVYERKWTQMGWVRSWLPGLLLLVSLSLVHSVYWSNMRMRSPLMPCVYMLALLQFSRRSSSKIV